MTILFRVLIISLLQDTQQQLRNAQTKLINSEKMREQRLKILQKTHQSAIASLELLIQNLQNIVLEKDKYISQLEDRLEDETIDKPEVIFSLIPVSIPYL